MAPRNRCTPGRHFTVYPDLDRPHFTVELYLTRGSRHFREAIEHSGFARHVPRDHNVSGQVMSRSHGMRHPLYHGRIVAYMFLDRKELRTRPSELVAHECGHAAMAWARYCNADLSRMGSSVKWRGRKREGEELLCYALGELVNQVNRVCFAAGVFPT